MVAEISLTIAADTCKLQSQSQRDEPREGSAHDAIRARVRLLAAVEETTAFQNDRGGCDEQKPIGFSDRVSRMSMVSGIYSRASSGLADLCRSGLSALFKSSRPGF